MAMRELFTHTCNFIKCTPKAVSILPIAVRNLILTRQDCKQTKIPYILIVSEISAT